MATVPVGTVGLRGGYGPLSSFIEVTRLLGELPVPYSGHKGTGSLAPLHFS